MRTDQTKTLVIGLDGGTFDVWLPLIEQGLMPNLASLMERGSWGNLESTIPPFTAAAWSSFATGTNPGKHGILSFQHTRDRFNYQLEGEGFANARDLRGTLWEILSAAEKKLGVVNVPLTYPPRAINGYMITGMLTPSKSQTFTYPPELAEALDPDYMIDVDFIRDEDDFRVRGFPLKTEMLSQICEMSRSRAKTCTKLLQTREWDFFMVVFTGTDRILHFFWDDLEAMITGSGSENDALQRGIQTYVRELDDAIGQLVEIAGPSTNLFVISDHGFGPAQTRRFYVNIWLEKLGLLHRRTSADGFDLEYLRVALGRNRFLKTLLRRLLPQSAQDKATAFARESSKDIFDWAHTSAFFVPIYFHICGIEINTVDVHREGIVALGSEYEKVRDQVIRESEHLVDPDTGQAIVRAAYRREDIFQGPFVDEFPDIILVLNPDYIGARSLAGNSLVEPHTPTRSGEHRSEGIFIARGPSLRPNMRLEDLRLMDMPPTLLHTLGLPVPESFDGQVVRDVFKPEFLSAHPVRKGELPSFRELDSQPTESYSDSDESKIADRLRGLGYLD